MKCDIIYLKIKKGNEIQMANIEYILVRFWDNQDKAEKPVIYTKEILNLLKTDPNVIDITDCETGEILYIKGVEL